MAIKKPGFMTFHVYRLHVKTKYVAPIYTSQPSVESINMKKEENHVLNRFFLEQTQK